MLLLSITSRGRGRLRSGRKVTCNSAEPSKSKDSPIINEDVLIKLRQFEAENQRLREQLAQQQDADSPEVTEAQKRARIDGKGMKRETMFSNPSQSGSWLSEADVDFFTGGGAFEGDKAEQAAMSVDAEAVVQKRVIIGAGVSVVAIALALIPTESLDGQASKPLSFYLVPVIRSVNLLEDLATEIDEGRVESIPLAISRILGKPNDARSNMYSAIEYIKSSSQAKQNARETVGNFVDYVQQADYNKYFDSLAKNSNDGKQNAEFVKFSLQSVRSAARSGREFLAYFPADELRNAQQLAEPAA